MYQSKLMPDILNQVLIQAILKQSNSHSLILTLKFWFSILMTIVFDSQIRNKIWKTFKIKFNSMNLNIWFQVLIFDINQKHFKCSIPRYQLSFPAQIKNNFQTTHRNFLTYRNTYIHFDMSILKDIQQMPNDIFIKLFHFKLQFSVVLQLFFITNEIKCSWFKIFNLNHIWNKSDARGEKSINKEILIIRLIDEKLGFNLWS